MAQTLMSGLALSVCSFLCLWLWCETEKQANKTVCGFSTTRSWWLVENGESGSFYHTWSFCGVSRFVVVSSHNFCGFLHTTRNCQLVEFLWFFQGPNGNFDCWCVCLLVSIKERDKQTERSSDLLWLWLWLGEGGGEGRLVFDWGGVLSVAPVQ